MKEPRLLRENWKGGVLAPSNRVGHQPDGKKKSKEGGIWIDGRAGGDMIDSYEERESNQVPDKKESLGANRFRTDPFEDSPGWGNR